MLTLFMQIWFTKIIWTSFTVAKLRILNFQSQVKLVQCFSFDFEQLYGIRKAACKGNILSRRDGSDRAIGASDFVAGCEISEMENGCSGEDGLLLWKPICHLVFARICPNPSHMPQ
jgi:hypothetical protein